MGEFDKMLRLLRFWQSLLGKKTGIRKKCMASLLWANPKPITPRAKW